jgi:NitT/TauT family transport system permease protein/sulfonate transport system permease protein
MRAERTSVTSVIADHMIGEGLVVLALLAWWMSARGLPEFILPGPVGVVRRLIELFLMPEFLCTRSRPLGGCLSRLRRLF